MTVFKKYFLFVLISVIITGGLVLSVTSYRNINNIQDQTQQSLLSIATEKAKGVDIYTTNLHSLSKSIGDNVEILNYFKNLSLGEEDLEQLHLFKRNLEEEAKSYPELIENIFFVYKDIVIIDGIGGIAEGFDMQEEGAEWYLKVKDIKTHYLGKVQKSPISGLPVMVSAYPILDADHQLLAIFALPISLNGFSDIIIENTENSAENTIIVDEEGIVIAAEEHELIYNYNIQEQQPKLYDYVSGHEEGITYYNKDGINFIAATKKSELGLIIIQSLPVSEYKTPIIISIGISIAILIIIIILVAGVIYKIAKNITRPIDSLVLQLGEMTEGNYDGEIPEGLINRKDEFGKLGSALETMKKQTKSLIYNIKCSHEEIESSLEEVLAIEEELREHNEKLLESESNLKASEEQNKAIINVLPDTIFILDKEGKFLDCQASNENDLFMPKEILIGKNISIIMSPEIANTAQEKIRLALETNTLQSFEYELELNGSKEVFELRIVQSQPEKVMAIARNVTKQRRYQERIEYLSYHDQLTGLYNRRFFEEELNRLDTQRNFPLCIVMADVNGLKLINDSFGHQIGDLLLVKVAEVLKRACREDEIISRIGGDEFVIIVPRMKPEQTEDLIKRIKNISDQEMIANMNLSISFGWETKWTKEEDIDEVFNKAEDYMYKKKLFESPSMRGKTIGAIINALHEKNRREEEHSHRVSDLSKRLAIVSKLSEREIEEITSAGLLHDIGKIAIQENLLNKEGKLTKEEFEEVAKHPEIGYRILSSVNDLSEIAEIVLSHHERWDGKGYPRGLSAEEIPLQARMITIADSFDAMTSIRSYRTAVTEIEAAAELIRHAGTQFDPVLARLFVDQVLVDLNKQG